MAYRSLYTPLSQFVDPMSTEIGDMLRDRYLTNYQASSAVEQEMANLVAAPFEGDKKLRDNLVKETQMQLKNVAERGDYENMTLPVMNAAKRYNMESAPIKQNYELYTSYVDGMKKAYEEGTIDYEQYMGNIQLSNAQNSGLSKDPQGRYTGYFQGVDSINLTDVQIQERIHDALQGIVAEEYGLGAEIVGMNSPKGTLYVMQEGEVKEVSNSRVQSVMDMIMSDPQVRFYTQRKGEIRAINVTDEELLEKRQQTLSAYNTQILRLQEEKEKASTEEQKAQYNDVIMQLQSAAGRLFETTDPAALRGLYIQDQANSIEQQFRDSAGARYGYRSGKIKTSILPEYAQLINSDPTPSEVQGTYTAIPGEIQQITNPDGNTYSALVGSIAAQGQILESMEDVDYMQSAFNIPLTGAEIMKMSSQEFAQMYPNISVSFFEEAKSVVMSATAKKAAMEKRIQEVRETLGYDQEELERVKTNVNGASDVINAAVNKFGISEEEAMNLLSGYIRTRQNLSNMNQRKERDPQTGEVLYFINKDIYNEMNEMFGVSTDGSALFQRTPEYKGIRIHDIVRGIDKINNDVIYEIDNWLSENSTTSVQMPTYDNMPFNFQLTDAEKRSLDDAFGKGKPIPRGTTYYNEAGQLTSLEEAVESRAHRIGGEFDTASAKIAGYRFSPYDYSSMGGTIQITLQDSKGRQITIPTPMAQVSNPGLDRYKRSNINQFATIVGQQHARQVRDIIVPLVNAQTGEASSLVVNIGDVSENNRFSGSVQSLNAEGERVGKLYTLDEVTDPGPNGLLTQLQQMGFIVSYF